MTMNLGSHLISHWEMFKHLVAGDDEGAEATKDFYEEYRSVCDMAATFYLETVDRVFQRHLLPKGELVHRGRLEKPAPDSVAEHDQISEVYHVISGAATLVLGPDIVNRQRRPSTLRTVSLL